MRKRKAQALKDIKHPKFKYFLAESKRNKLGPRWAYDRFKRWEARSIREGRVRKKNKTLGTVEDLKEKYGDLDTRFRFLVSDGEN